MESTAQETGVGKQSAGKVLRDIVKDYPGKLSMTGGLVLAENGLELLYPVIAGIALDAVLEGYTLVSTALLKAPTNQKVKMMATCLRSKWLPIHEEVGGASRVAS